jgi:hypothetical protein
MSPGTAALIDEDEQDNLNLDGGKVCPEPLQLSAKRSTLCRKLASIFFPLFHSSFRHLISQFLH